MNRFYLKELEQLRNHFLLMAEKSTEAVANAVIALEQSDPSLARQVIGADDELDQLEVAIDAEATRYITLRSPVAGDLRLLTVALRASQDLERIADEACSIAKRSLRTGEIPDPLDHGKIRLMADLALALMRESIDSLLEEDAERALAVLPKDKEIDRLHRDNYDYFSARIVDRPDLAKAYIELIFISKSIERIGDHATNIAEEIVYLVKGRDVRHSEEAKRP